jgi:hypothetical protein
MGLNLTPTNNTVLLIADKDTPKEYVVCGLMIKVRQNMFR